MKTKRLEMIQETAGVDASTAMILFVTQSLIRFFDGSNQIQRVIVAKRLLE